MDVGYNLFAARFRVQLYSLR